MIKWKPEAIEAAFRAFDDKKYEVLSKRGKAKIAPDMEYILNEAVRAQGLFDEDNIKINTKLSDEEIDKAASEVLPKTHKKLFKDMTLQELREEREFWKQKLENGGCWGASVTAASEFLKDCDRWIARREKESK